MRVPIPIRVVPSLAFRAWLTPPPLGRATASRDGQLVAGLTPVHFGGVPGYEIGSGSVVIAAHGWGGRVARMVPMARRLAAEGNRVIIPTLPGYAGGPATDIKQVASVFSDLIDDVGDPE